MREFTLPHVLESCPDCRLRAAGVFPNVDLSTVATIRRYTAAQPIFREGDEPMPTLAEIIAEAERRERVAS